MKLVSFCILLFCALNSLGQTSVTGHVENSETGERLSFVHVRVNNSPKGVYTDFDGKFRVDLDTAIHTLSFSSMGYENMDISGDALRETPLVVLMKGKSYVLNEAVVENRENPAHRIIKLAEQHRKYNDPDNLESYNTDIYHKMTVYPEGDSLRSLDTTNYSDTTLYNLKLMSDTMHFFMMENVCTRHHRKGKEYRDVIKANRVSGLKDPSFILLGAQLQDFNYYKNYLKVLSNDFLSPIAPSSKSYYVFELLEKRFQQGDTTFLISFQPKKAISQSGLKGFIEINSDQWAIQSIVASESDEDNPFTIRLEMKSEQMKGKWFINSSHFRLSLPDMLPGSSDLIVDVNNAFSNTSFENSDLKLPSAYKMIVEDSASVRSNAFWEEYRLDSLDKKEQNTYVLLDSLGEEFKFDEKLRWFTALTEGKIGIKKIDLNLKNLMVFNLYEGLRINMGLETNEKFSEHLQFGGSAGYGFKDRKLKYSAFGELKLHKNTGLSLGYSFKEDIRESGGEYWVDDIPKRLIMDSDVRSLWKEQFDKYRYEQVYLKFSPYPQLRFYSSIGREYREMLNSNYLFSNTQTENVSYWSNATNTAILRLSLNYSPRNEYVKGPFGVKPLKRVLPVYSLQYTRAIPFENMSDLSFDKFDFRVRWNHRSRYFGLSKIMLSSGVVLGDAPYGYLNHPRSNAPRVNGQGNLLFPADEFAFETMRNNEFINSNYVSFMIRHHFEGRILRLGNSPFNPELAISFRGIYGVLNNPELHKGIPIRDNSQGYFEVGLELNKILQSTGIGVYYRFGSQQLPIYADNFAVKLTATLSNVFDISKQLFPPID